MKLILIFFIFGYTTLAYKDYFVKLDQLCGCSDTGDADAEYLLELDDDEVAFVNFRTKKDIITLPSFADSVTFPELYPIAENNKEVCQTYIENYKTFEKNPPEAKDPPQITIYPKDEVEPGVENTFVCYVTEFYPPHIKVVWSRNNERVTEGTHTGQFSLNSDGTFNIFSTLRSSPEDGDIYSCTVEHRALDQPKSRVLEVDSHRPDIGPSVCCGVGLTIGILGIATGIYFFIKDT